MCVVRVCWASKSFLRALSVPCSRLKFIFHLKAHRTGILITQDIVLLIYLVTSFQVHSVHFLRAIFFLFCLILPLAARPHFISASSQHHQQPFISRRSWLTLKFIALNFPHSSIALKSYSLSEKMKSAMCV